MFLYLLIALGGALGSVARHWLTESVTARLDGPFPWGTFLVNLTGCLAIGFFASAAGSGGRPFATTEARAFFMIGVCGGYTTFSAFSLQTVNLLRLGDWPRAAAYVIGSVVLCLVGVWLGHLLAHALNPAR
jgi:CrcB protein